MPLKKSRSQALQVGLLVTGLQIALALSAIPRGRSLSFSSLCRWDCSDWYLVIAREGYRSSIPPLRQKPHDSNVAFFPAFPLMARGISNLTRIPQDVALVVLAQLACVAFWTTLWMLLRRWRVSERLAHLTVLATLAHPAAFYLVTGYSESLFLASLLSFVLLVSSDAPSLTAPAMISGALMSATRLVGLPVAAYPITQRLFQRGPPRLRKALAVSLAAAAGALAFLAYCKLRWGRFDLYMQTQRIGWGIQPDYLAPLKWRQFVYHHPFDRRATIFSGLAFVLLGAAEALLLLLRKRTDLRRRVPVYLAALAIFCLTVAGLKNQEFIGMIRYTLPWHVLLLACLAHLLSRLPRLPERAAGPLFLLACAALVTLLLTCQLPHLRDYLAGRWVS